MQFVKPIPFAEAQKKLGARSPIGAQLSSTQWSAVPVALRERAFFSANIESVKWLQEAKNSITDFIDGNKETIPVLNKDGTPKLNPDGTPKTVTALKTGSKAAFVEHMRRKAIELGLGPLDPDDAGTIKDPRSEKRLALIFKVQTESSYAYGDRQQGLDPDVLNEFPGIRFLRVISVKVERDHHQQFEDQVFLKTDVQTLLRINEDFGVPWAPWGWGCGHDTEDVDRDETDALGLTQPGQSIPGAPENGELEPFNQNLKASVRNLDPDLKKFLKDQFGDQIKIEKDSAWWNGDRAGKALTGLKRTKKAEPPAAPAPSQEAAPVDARAFPESLDDLVHVRKLGGSTGAELVRHKTTGEQFVLKRGASPAHVREEFAADQLYRSQGVAVPEARLYESGKDVAKVARYIEGQTLKTVLAKASPAERAAILQKIQQHFGVDALLGNWDVAGLEYDNILVDKAGTPWRIDNGGSLRFRAMGAQKSAEDWNGFPREIWTLRNAKENAQTARVFEGLDIFQIARQVRGIDAAKLLDAAPEAVKAVLQARLAQMQSLSGKALEYQQSDFIASYADEVTRHMLGLRASGALDRMAPELKQGHPGDVRPVDAQGRPFDFLRTQAKTATTDPSQVYFDDILQAVKTINAHHAKGDTTYNAAKLQKALAHKPALEKAALAGGETAEMARHYLKFINQIEASKGQLDAVVSQFTKFDLKSFAASPASRSVVSEMVDYMKANGGDWNIVQSWAASQGGASSSPQAMALKRWLLDRLNVPASEFHNAPQAAHLAAVRKDASYDRSFEIFHAFIQEVLGRLEFAGNDRAASLVRILRTESNTKAVPFKKGQKGIYNRGVNESGSIFAAVFHGSRTITIVPHVRVTSVYFLERQPGTGHSFLYGDSENEFTYMAHRLPAKNMGVGGNINLSPGTDHTKWELSN